MFGFDTFSVIAHAGGEKPVNSDRQEAVTVRFTAPKSEPNLKSSYVFPLIKGSGGVEHAKLEDKPVPKER